MFKKIFNVDSGVWFHNFLYVMSIWRVFIRFLSHRIGMATHPPSLDAKRFSTGRRSTYVPTNYSYGTSFTSWWVSDLYLPKQNPSAIKYRLRNTETHECICAIFFLLAFLVAPFTVSAMELLLEYSRWIQLRYILEIRISPRAQFNFLFIVLPAQCKIGNEIHIIIIKMLFCATSLCGDRNAALWEYMMRNGYPRHRWMSKWFSTSERIIFSRKIKCSSAEHESPKIRFESYWEGTKGKPGMHSSFLCAGQECVFPANFFVWFAHMCNWYALVLAYNVPVQWFRVLSGT